MLKIIIVHFEVNKLHVHLCKRMNCIYLYCYLNGKFFSKGMRFTYQSHNIKSLKETSLGRGDMSRNARIGENGRNGN